MTEQAFFYVYSTSQKKTYRLNAQPDKLATTSVAKIRRSLLHSKMKSDEFELYYQGQLLTSDMVGGDFGLAHKCTLELRPKADAAPVDSVPTDPAAPPVDVCVESTPADGPAEEVAAAPNGVPEGADRGVAGRSSEELPPLADATVQSPPVPQPEGGPPPDEGSLLPDTVTDWVWKLGGGYGIFSAKNWKRRWFTVSPSGFDYREKEGAPALKQATWAEASDVHCGVTKDRDSHATDASAFYFGVSFMDRGKARLLLCRAETEASRRRMVQAMLRHVPQHVCPPAGCTLAQ
eukprot:TRINITY_DN8403_c0_g1_i1.p1 TRINITY_DN8403_c0_g1~~TRINITY_DN8403_c0_g1_i1.p1  ORF type:complete len:291 (+),score=60.08 TRINITY_DN8403_c0_g1_i1:146-1018(+)